MDHFELLEAGVSGEEDVYARRAVDKHRKDIFLFFAPRRQMSTQKSRKNAFSHGCTRMMEGKKD
jgi:hypothetical protein